MKKYALIPLLIIFNSFCDSPIDNSSDEEAKADCASLRTGIIEMDPDIVIPEINKLVTDLEPASTDNDQLGHKENIDILVERLNTQCDSISAELLCYACIYTNPPQSEIILTTDSSGTMVTRIVDILTPNHANLECIRIH